MNNIQLFKSNKALISHLIKTNYLKTPRIIKAFLKIDRGEFVLDKFKNQAYLNQPLPIGYEQTISQPATVAFMMELLEPKPGQKILDIGAGSGWQTALLAEIVGKKGKIYAMELIPELKLFGEKNVDKFNFIKDGIVKFFCKNALNGLPALAPYNRIIAAAAAQTLPKTWRKQLKIHGRLVAPEGNNIVIIKRKGRNTFQKQKHWGFSFVPLC